MPASEIRARLIAAHVHDQRRWEVALIIRLAKAILCMPLALFGLLVAVNNVIDYSTNYAFVRHVFSMDTTFPGNALLGRAITDPVVWQLGYGAIIVGEALTGLCFLAAAVTLMANLPAPPAFEMWQSKTWNGQEPAFRFMMTILAVVIFVAQREPDAT